MAVPCLIGANASRNGAPAGSRSVMAGPVAASHVLRCFNGLKSLMADAWAAMTDGRNLPLHNLPPMVPRPGMTQAGGTVRQGALCGLTRGLGGLFEGFI